MISHVVMVCHIRDRKCEFQGAKFQGCLGYDVLKKDAYLFLPFMVGQIDESSKTEGFCQGDTESTPEGFLVIYPTKANKSNHPNRAHAAHLTCFNHKLYK